MIYLQFHHSCLILRCIFTKSLYFGEISNKAQLEKVKSLFSLRYCDKENFVERDVHLPVVGRLRLKDVHLHPDGGCWGAVPAHGALRYGSGWQGGVGDVVGV